MSRSPNRRMNVEINDILHEFVEQHAERMQTSKTEVLVGAVKLLQWSVRQHDRGLHTAAVRQEEDGLVVYENSVMPTTPITPISPTAE